MLLSIYIYNYQNEIVHHKNDNPKDNRIKNLKLTTRSYHALHHMKKGDLKILKLNKVNKIKYPNGYAWCWKCKTYKLLNQFPPSKLKNRKHCCTKCGTQLRNRKEKQ